jgi:hypothetical protein
MKMEKFTKGEWSAQPTGELSFNVCVLSKGVSVYSNVKAVNDAKFDAALIAAAPEMYAMLKDILPQVAGSPSSLKINRILTKARGEK